MVEKPFSTWAVARNRPDRVFHPSSWLMPTTAPFVHKTLSNMVWSDRTCRVAVLPRGQLDENDLAQWRDLADRSLHDNPFLLPEFVLPAWRHLTPEQQHVLLVVACKAEGRWLAAGAVRLGRITPHMLTPHALAFSNRYTFRTGLLVDRCQADLALTALVAYLAAAGPMCQGIEFPNLPLDSPLAHALQAVARRLGHGWETLGVRAAPAVFPCRLSEEYFQQCWSKDRRKSQRRQRARLETLGPVTLRLARSPREVAAALETFLRLEHDGWKGEGGTALLCKQQDQTFVRTMAAGLAERGNIIVSELLAGQRVAAAAINLVAGSTLCAFKIGWDRTLAFAGPGVLHEAELMRAGLGSLRGFTLFDSCSEATSYIGNIWPERIRIGTGVLCCTPWARWGMRLHQATRAFKRLVCSWL